MPFLKEPEPPYGDIIPEAPGISRVVARNPSVMTYHGTNTWFIDGPDGLTVIDPGPDNPEHLEATLRAGAGRIARIVMTHTHSDHVGNTAALKAATNAPTYGYHTPEAAHFTPDVPLDDGDEVAGLTAVFTPGHAADHLCFAAPNGILFSGDHVMGWNSSIVNPPKGNMIAYFNSLQRLLDRPETTYFAGHGPKLTTPHPFVRDLLAHRIRREKSIAAKLTTTPTTPSSLTDALYSQTHPWLRQAAERNVVAHLLKLEQEGHAVRDGEFWRAA